MTEPGWYNDEQDPALARWHDGRSWTEHTLVKAEWHGPGEPPPPLQRAFAAAPVVPPLPAPEPLEPPRRGVGERYRALPLWARIAAPVAAGVVAIGAATGGGDDDDGGTVDDPPATVEVVSLDDAIAIAQRELAFPVPSASLGSLIRQLCAVDPDAGGRAARAITTEPDELHDVVQAAGEGALAHCSDDVSGRRSLLNETYAAALVVERADDTTTTAPVATSTTALAATRPPTTTPPVATTPQAPVQVAPTPTQAPPTTAAPPPAQGGVYYRNCDAARAAGAAPVRVGDPGYASHLDRDGDGVGCE